MIPQKLNIDDKTVNLFITNSYDLVIPDETKISGIIREVFEKIPETITYDAASRSIHIANGITRTGKTVDVITNVLGTQFKSNSGQYVILEGQPCLVRHFKADDLHLVRTEIYKSEAAHINESFQNLLDHKVMGFLKGSSYHKKVEELKSEVASLKRAVQSSETDNDKQINIHHLTEKVEELNKKKNLYEKHLNLTYFYKTVLNELHNELITDLDKVPFDTEKKYQKELTSIYSAYQAKASVIIADYYTQTDKEVISLEKAKKNLLPNFLKRNTSLSKKWNNPLGAIHLATTILHAIVRKNKDNNGLAIINIFNVNGTEYLSKRYLQTDEYDPNLPRYNESFYKKNSKDKFELLTDKAQHYKKKLFLRKYKAVNDGELFKLELSKVNKEASKYAKELAKSAPTILQRKKIKKGKPSLLGSLMSLYEKHEHIADMRHTDVADKMWGVVKDQALAPSPFEKAASHDKYSDYDSRLEVFDGTKPGGRLYFVNPEIAYGAAFQDPAVKADWDHRRNDPGYNHVGVKKIEQEAAPSNEECSEDNSFKFQDDWEKGL